MKPVCGGRIVISQFAVLVGVSLIPCSPGVLRAEVLFNAYYFQANIMGKHVTKFQLDALDFAGETSSEHLDSVCFPESSALSTVPTPIISLVAPLLWGW